MNPRRPARFRAASLLMALRIGLVASVLVKTGLATLAPGADRPPDILSWRHQILQRSTYESLADRWRAWVEAHPSDAEAWVQWGNALRYSGRYDEANEKYQRAFAVDSSDVAAVTAHAHTVTINLKTEEEWKQAHRRLLAAAARHPDYAPLYYTLWSTALRTGDEPTVQWCLRRMVESGDMPRPLLEYGANMVRGAPPNAILLTNGDNDTYPPLAFQHLTGERPDVAIVNLSLLNAPWYVRYWRDRGLPITLTDAEIDSLKPISKKHLPSHQVVEHLYRNLSSAPNPRPLCYAVTVYEGNRTLPARRMAEGLQERILYGAPADTLVETDWSRMRLLVDTVYRMESALDPILDWTRESSVSRGMQNYAAILGDLGEHHLEISERTVAEAYLFRAVQILAFHSAQEYAQRIIDLWAKADPEARLLPEARRLVSGGG